ncbi:MAG: hypothetical protein CFE24_03955 [Flavobacterium sp. BFFFF2]|nr:MAG: hypothetical protein CFE24_03955 [Flavobacterium sp. BFFFF2]
MKYFHDHIESKWQQYWREHRTFAAENNSQLPKYYVLDMFPYPSGAGLHVGHPLGYIASDIVSRYKRHKGFNVLHPMGYDSFGLPAEQYAIQTGQHPEKTTRENIARYREQLDRMGFSFDWDREVRTSNPDYYKHTQWIFSELFNSYYCLESQQAKPISALKEIFEKDGNQAVQAVCDEDTPAFTAAQWQAFTDQEQHRLMLHYRLTYLAETEVNWCPGLGTVLANDEIVNGVSERGGHAVIRKKMTQWSMRISAYAERLLQGLNDIDWSESIKESQRNWIGKSVGASVKFKILPPAPSEGGGDVAKLKSGPKYLTGDPIIASKLLEFAKENRKAPTLSESILWDTLRRENLDVRFRRQHLIGQYIVDFVCLERRLIIEVDGEYHNSPEQQNLDAERTLELEKKHQFKVLRFTNDDVNTKISFVINKIKEHLNNGKSTPNPTPSPSGRAGEGTFIEVFTTRPDTLFGVTFMTLAPEHDLVSQITTPEQKAAVDAYIDATAKRSERERMADVKTISGVFTGAYAMHPFTNEAIPIWIGDYVLAGYGTGAVMAVPCGDDRDFAFASHFAGQHGMPAIKNIFNRDLTPNPSPKERGLTETDVNNIEYFNKFPYFSAKPDLAKRLVAFAKENRKSATEAEDLMWQSLRSAALGYKIRRQHYIGPFIVDFVCLSRQLVIELDGSIHEFQKEYDLARTEMLQELGFEITRFSNEEVLREKRQVLEKIKSILSERPDFTLKSENSPSPWERGPGGEVTEAFTLKDESFTYIQSDFLNGLTYKTATQKVLAALEEGGAGQAKVNYRLRDAVFSRQRYWGEPFPVYYVDGLPQIIEPQHLPVVLPEVEKYLPTDDGQPPLGNASVWAWNTQTHQVVANELIDHQTVFPLELNTMPGWAGSSWYWMRYMDAHNATQFCTEEALEYWQNVDLYIGGSEHATGHLLYARFWNKFLKDRGFAPTEEPFKKLINQGMILGTGAYYPFFFCTVKISIDIKYLDSKKANYINADLNVLVFTRVTEKINDGTLDSIFPEIPQIDRNEISSQIRPIYKKYLKEQYNNNEIYEISDEFFNVEVMEPNYDLNPKRIPYRSIDPVTLEIDVEKMRQDTMFSFAIKTGNDRIFATTEVGKMSKSWLNVVSPDDICHEYGADTLRLYEMFLGPLEQSKPWSTGGISGVYGFLKKLWRLYFTDEGCQVIDDKPTADMFKSLHKTIKKVTEDIEQFSFNTSVSQFMICVNELTQLKCHHRAILEPLAVLVSPYAPHIAEELWQALGHQESIERVPFPIYDAQYLVESNKEYPVSFNGKMRFTLNLPLDLSVEEIEAQVMADERTQQQLQGRTPNKVIIVPGKIINLVG